MLFVLGILEELIEVADLSSRFPHILLSTSTITLLIGPVLFLYGRILTSGKSSLNRIDLIHFIPFLASTAYLLPFYLQSGEAKLATVRSGSLDTLVVVLAIVKGVHLLSYFSVTLVAVFRFQASRQNLSAPQIRRLAWFTRSLSSLLIIALLSGVLYFSSVADDSTFDTDYLISFLLTLVIYAWVIVAIRDPDTLFIPRIRETVEGALPDADESRRGRYETSPLDVEKKKKIADRMVALMENEKLYLDPDFRRADLADLLGVSLHHLSEVLNDSLGMNYAEFINSYRLNEVKRTLSDSANDHKTILAVAFEAGFRSKSTFNRIFREQVGVTAREFRKQAGQE